MSTLPYQTPVGVAHRGIIPLDFQIISNFSKKLPPAWEGMLEGLQFLQLLVGDFGGLQRAFAVVLGEVSNQIEIWELTSQTFRDNGDNRILWRAEFPSYAWNDEFQLKKLVGAEIWLDNINGTVDFDWEYRPDSSACWYPWHKFRICSARDCRESDVIPCPDYPIQPFCGSNRFPISLPVPPAECDGNNNRPSSIGYNFQPRCTIKGQCTIRGLLVYAEKQLLNKYRNLVCVPNG